MTGGQVATPVFAGLGRREETDVAVIFAKTLFYDSFLRVNDDVARLWQRLHFAMEVMWHICCDIFTSRADDAVAPLLRHLYDNMVHLLRHLYFVREVRTWHHCRNFFISREWWYHTVFLFHEIGSTTPLSLFYFGRMVAPQGLSL